MNSIGLKQLPLLKTQLQPKLIGGLKLSNFMEMPENGFNKLVHELETDPLFKRLVYPEDRNCKVVSYSRFPKTDISHRFFEFKEEISPEKSTFDVETLLDKRKEAAEIIKSLGMVNFKKYFLYNEFQVNAEEISSNISMDIEKVNKVVEFVNEYFMHEGLLESSRAGRISSSSGINYHRIAAVEIEGGEFIVEYMSPIAARGKYAVDYQKLKSLAETSYFKKSDKSKVNQLIKKIELVNFRKTLIYRIVQKLLEVQDKYVRSAKVESLSAYAQKELARDIETNPAVVCRAIAQKSIVIPCGQEIPLKNLLPSKKSLRLRLFKEVVENNDKMSDEKMRVKLEKEYNISLSRRSVNEYKREARRG